MKMSFVQVLFAAYGAMMMVGGVLGYKKAGSKMSLYSGIVSGIVILIGVLLASGNPGLGFGIIVLASLVLTGVFAIRFKKTKQFMPSGMLLTLSLLSLALSLVVFFNVLQ